MKELEKSLRATFLLRREQLKASRIHWTIVTIQSRLSAWRHSVANSIPTGPLNWGMADFNQAVRHTKQT